MGALRLFSKHAPNLTFLAVILGSLSGLFYAFLIPVVMKALSEEDSFFEVENRLVEVFGIDVAYSQFAYVFLGLCFLIIVFKSFSEIILSKIALDIRYHLRKELYTQVSNSPIAALENVGHSRLIQALSTDVSAIVNGAQLFPQLLTAAVTLIGMLGYLAYIDMSTFIYILEIIIFGALSFQIPIYFGTKYYIKARDHQNILQEAFRGIVAGAKELKLSVDKQQVYADEVLHKQEKIIKNLERKGMTVYSLANNYGNLLCFFAIGGLSFIFINYNAITNTQVIAAVMVLLYVTGPVAMLLNFIPALARTRISLRKIEQLYQELPSENISTEILPVDEWKSLRLKKIKYTHLSDKANAKTFEIGPVSLEIKRGEITFIAGGNGSGKSTLAKVISQHYSPSEGDIYYDGVKVTEDNLTSYRAEVSCIYSDYYLFERLLDSKSLSGDYKAQVDYYLKAFGLEEKVEIKDGHFSTLKLSDGQRRRLALVVAIVEDKSLLVFDEWAADQDPQFKQVFYHEILPYLKRKNKAVVVISHDDRFFDIADQLLVMESGKLVEQQDLSFLFEKHAEKEKVLA